MLIWKEVDKNKTDLSIIYFYLECNRKYTNWILLILFLFYIHIEHCQYLLNYIQPQLIQSAYISWKNHDQINRVFA